MTDTRYRSDTKGEYPKSILVPLLRELIDSAMRPNSTAHRDVARAKLKELLGPPGKPQLGTADWNTRYVKHNLNPKRCKYLAGLGYPIESRWLMRDWIVRPGRDKGDIEE